MGQLAVAFPWWHSDYDENLIARSKLWVAMTRSDGAWLNSLLLHHPTFERKCGFASAMIFRPFSASNWARITAIFHGQHVSVDGFYNSYFKPMPQTRNRSRRCFSHRSRSPCKWTGNPIGAWAAVLGRADIRACD